MSQFRCQIVTPAESYLDEMVNYVSFPAWDGQVGVMPSTSPFLIEIGTGSWAEYSSKMIRRSTTRGPPG